jgi:hypothetical protein
MLKAKFYDFTKTRVCSIVDDPVPNIYQKNNITLSGDTTKQRYNWFGYGEEEKDDKKI